MSESKLSAVLNVSEQKGNVHIHLILPQLNPESRHMWFSGMSEDDREQFLTFFKVVDHMKGELEKAEFKEIGE